MKVGRTQSTQIRLERVAKRIAMAARWVGTCVETVVYEEKKRKKQERSAVNRLAGQASRTSGRPQ